MNVTELARKLRITPNKLREIMPQLGFDIGVHAIKVDEKMARAILDKLSNQQVREKYLVANISKEIKKEIRTGTMGDENRIVQLPEKITVKELAKRMDIPVTNLMLVLMKNGIMASLNQDIDFETASIIIEDMGYMAEKSDEIFGMFHNIDYGNLLTIDKNTAVSRPPVVVIMGHVDHGKTKLLDAIRKTNIVDGEAGGITQHIGAYQVKKNERLLTFIDTPGHEAFSAMRSRGAQVADIAILLVAADDGVQPQTIEAVAHIRQANLPFIVAINKIDLPNANIDKVKSDLANINLTPEDWGGKTICSEISAKKNINIDILLDTLFLVADIHKEDIVANPEKAAIGTIIESHIDKGEGPVPTVLIHNGTLKKGDLVKIGNIAGKIRMMKDWTNSNIFNAPPSTPVKILGLKGVPLVGDILSVVADKKMLRGLSKGKKASNMIDHSHNFINDKKNEDEEEKRPVVKIILKTDVLGSAEAIIESLEKIDQDRVEVCIIKKGLGNITEADVEQACGLDSKLVGFHVKIIPEARKLATTKNIDIPIFEVIYDLISFIEGEIKEIAGVEKVEKRIGELSVLAIFRTGKGWQIVGGVVSQGKIINSSQARIIRAGEKIGELKITEVESGKVKVNEVAEGQEAGIRVEGDVEVQEKDILEVYIEEDK